MKMRKSLAFLLVLVMLMSLIPATALTVAAANADPWSIKDATEKTVYYTILDENDQPTQARAVTAYEDSYLNSDSAFTVRLYVPEGADAETPIAYIVNNSGWRSNGHMLADNEANLWSATDPAAPAQFYPATHSVELPSNDNYGAGKYAGQALEAGYVVVTAELRARGDDNHSPVTVGDAKAVIRYLRHNADALPAGDVDYIIVSGMSGGGALTSAIGASGNSTDYLPYLYALGAAGVEYKGAGEGPNLVNYMDYKAADFTDSLTDDIFAAVVYAPITDLSHADMAYSWTYHAARLAMSELTSKPGEGNFTEAALSSSAILGEAFVEYVDSLGLSYNGKKVDATFNAETGEIGGVLADVISDLAKKSIQHRIDNPSAPYYRGVGMKDSLEAKGYASKYSIESDDDAWKTAWLEIADDESKTNVESFDLASYLYFVAGYTALKNAPAFDGQGAQTGEGRTESNLYGLAGQKYNHILEYTFTYDPYTLGLYDPENSDPDTAWEKYVSSGDYAKVELQARMVNSVPYLLDSEGDDQGDSAPHWYLRHGMLDRDTSFATVALLYLSLLNAEDVEDVDARFTWDRIHNWQPYHDTPDSFEWVMKTVAAAKVAENNTDIADATVTELTPTVDGEPVKVKLYVDNYSADPVNETNELVNVYVPENASAESPIMLYVNNSGWQSNSYPDPAGSKATIVDGKDYNGTNDRVGVALKEGYVVVSYGCRSRSDKAVDGEYLGHSPATMTDTKAVIRYLRANDAAIAGDAEKIVVTGTSGGGALSVVIAGSGNSADYYPSLYEVGAAGIVKNADGSYSSTINDDVWATIAYCPITDLGNACAAYEWTWGAARYQLIEAGVTTGKAPVELQKEATALLKANFEEYVDSLNIGVTSATLRDTIIDLMKAEIEDSIAEFGIEQMKKDLGDATWLVFNEDGSWTYDYDAHVLATGTQKEFKDASGFSNTGMSAWKGNMNEDNLFGSRSDAYSPFNEYSWNNDDTPNAVGKDDTGLTWDEYMNTEAGKALSLQMKMTSPIQYLLDGDKSDSASNWYVRYGMYDRDSSWAIETVLLKAMEADKSIEDINFEFAWLKGHSGNYDVAEAYAWLKDKLSGEDGFIDVVENDWFYDEVKYVHENELMNGMGDNLFQPGVNVTRAMAITTLYRMAGSPAVTGSSSFTDLAASWYKDAVQWGVAEGITNGVSDTKFDPNSAITREQLATMLYRYAEYAGIDVSAKADLGIYSDAASISKWADDAMAWANAAGLITGDTATTLSPKADSNRAVLATVLMRYCETIA